MPSEPASRALRAIIVDDEPRARATLRHLLSAAGSIELVAEASDAESAVQLTATHVPDVLFLDVEMPEGSGLTVVEQLPPTVAVVFTTAYDQHAVAAFELGAVDYLRKPFGAERLAAAVRRVRASSGRLTAGAESTHDVAEPSPALVERVRWTVHQAASDAPPLTRLFVRDRGRIVPIRTRDIVHLQGEDDYVALHVGGQRHLVYLTMGEFERRLDPDRFLRVHRSHIVNLDFVTALVPFDGTRLQVVLRDGTTIVASRAASRELRQLAI